MVGNFAERKYQLAAQKRTEAALKFDYYNQAAKYFALECSKAKQFNNWKVDNLKSKYQDNIRKASELQSRQNRLRELLTTEEEEYKQQYNQLKAKKKLSRVDVSLEDLKRQLKERRSERSLYTPQISRRAQSYFCYPTTLSSRLPLKELHNSRTIKSSKMSLENTNIRDEYSVKESNIQTNISKAVNHSNVREDFDERALAAKENRSNALTSSFGNDYNPNEIDYSSISSRPLSRKNHSNIFYGKQTDIRENNDFNSANEKYAKRYERASLENTNLVEDISDKVTEPYDIQNEPKSIDETDDREYINSIPDEKHIESDNYQDFSKAYDDDAANDVAIKLGDVHLHHNEKKNSNDSPKKYFEHGSPTGRLTYNDKNRTELIFLYLTHNDLKRKIADLEIREQRACSKGRWDDALRLRDMKNRLELMREREIYQRDDLNIDPVSRKSVVENIQQRKHLLEEREKSCTDSEMYSEDAKLMWDKWVKEDAKPFITDGNNEREVLLKQLEEEWRRLAENDKQRLTNTYNNVMMGSTLQKELKLISSKISG